MRQLQLEQAKQVTKLRQEVEQGARDLASKADRRMKVTSCGFTSSCAWLLSEGGGSSVAEWWQHSRGSNS